MPGLGWYEDGKDTWYDAAGIVRKIKSGRGKGLAGFVIFQLGTPGVDDWILVNALATDGPDNNNDAPFEEPAISWLASDRQVNYDLAPPGGDEKVNALDYVTALLTLSLIHI